MNTQTLHYSRFWSENRRNLLIYLFMVGILLTGMVIYFLIEGKYRLLGAMFLPLGFLIIVTNPKLAFYQYIFFIFTNYVFLSEPVVLYVDVSAFLVIATAILDILLKADNSISFPKLSLNFISLFCLFVLVALFSYNPALSFKPLLRNGVLVVTFLSLYRLSRYIEIGTVLRFFFWLAVANAFIALLPFFESGIIERYFGFARSTLDDLMMIAFPIGVVFYLRAGKNKALLYATGLLFVIIALIGTQSRLPILFTAFFSAIAVYLTKKSVRQAESAVKRVVVRRILMIFGIIVSSVVLLVIIAPAIVGDIIGRFRSLLTYAPSETFLIRIVLWKNALYTFWHNPIFGLGLGHYRILYTIYPFVHLHFMYQYTLGLSAHNLILHFLAETGIVGTSAIIALLVNQFRLSRITWKMHAQKKDTQIILMMVSILFLVTSFIEAGWLWGQSSFIFLFFIVLIVKNHELESRE